MIFKVPKIEHRKFNYKPMYYNPDKISEESKETSAENSEEARMRERIHSAFQKQQRHKRVPFSRLWLYVLILVILLMILYIM